MTPRKRAGTYATFDRRYKPILLDDGSLMRDWRDPKVLVADPRFIWTVVEGDTGTLYLVPGFASVNYIGRVLCEVPWPDEEELAPGYVY